MNKNIWFLHHYATPHSLAGLTRPYDFSIELIKDKYKCTIFTSSYLHFAGYNVIKDKSDYKIECDNNVSFVYVKTSGYKKNRFKRIKNIIDYYFRIARVEKEYVKMTEKPDVIIASSAHPLALLAGQKLAKKYKIECICEIRDLWPESFTSYNLLSVNNPIMKLLYLGEKFIYKKADKLLFTMEGGKDYIIQRKWDTEQGGPIDIKKVYHINNGVDLDLFFSNKELYTIKDPDLDNHVKFKVVYTGSLRLVNNVMSIIYIAEELQKTGNEKVQFLIYGQGDDRDNLEKYCREHKVNNVIFKGFVEKKYIPYILSKSDLLILHFNQNSVQKYGASLNKMFEYFASGKPILSDCEFGYDLIKKYKCGVVINKANPIQMASEVTKFSNMSKETYEFYCINAIKAAKDYDFKVLTKKLEKLF